MLPVYAEYSNQPAHFILTDQSLQSSLLNHQGFIQYFFDARFSDPKKKKKVYSHH